MKKYIINTFLVTTILTSPIAVAACQSPIAHETKERSEIKFDEATINNILEELKNGQASIVFYEVNSGNGNPRVSATIITPELNVQFDTRIYDLARIEEIVENLRLLFPISGEGLDVRKTSSMAVVEIWGDTYTSTESGENPDVDIGTATGELDLDSLRQALTSRTFAKEPEVKNPEDSQ
jgi:hypothetical protein